MVDKPKDPGGAAVVIDGRQFWKGHPDAWRFGVTLPQEHASLVAVLCQPRGRERKTRKIMCSPTWLLLDTPELRAAMVAAGV